MSITSQIFDFAVNLLKSSGYPGLFALMVLESATLPVPSELVLPLAGYLVYTGQLNFLLAVIVSSAGSLVGTLIDYSIGFYLGRAVVLRYGRYVRLHESQLKTAEKWFAKYGEAIVLLARFVPLIRTLVAFPAGIAEMKIWKFVVFSMIGIVVWDSILIYIGYFFGQNYNSIVTSLTNVFTLVEILAVVAVIVVLVLWVRRKPAKKENVVP
ncbi:MAG: DedA family protein [Thaumarchaeota archaeon]|nr:DedA family protein [Nitrososphaerota archaeon]